MKTKVYFLVVVFLTFVAGTVLAQNSKTPTITKTFEMNQPGTLKSSSSGGGITVSTHERAEVVVNIFVRKKGRVLSPGDSEIEDVLDAYDLVVEKNGNAITATAKRQSRGKFWNNTGIYFHIVTPKEMSCSVSSSGGGLKISGVYGTHDFSSSGGSVKLENTGGTTKATSSGGGVSAYKHKGDIKLSSSGGSVKVDKAKGNVYARSSGGSVKLDNIIGDVEAGSSGGGVYVNGECAYVKASSSGGPVKVHTSGLKKELDLHSSGGGVEAVIINGDKLGLDLDLSAGRVNIDLHNFSGKSEKSRIKGSMNGGGIPLHMRASGGNVTVRYED